MVWGLGSVAVKYRLEKHHKFRAQPLNEITGPEWHKYVDVNYAHAHRNVACFVSPASPP